MDGEIPEEIVYEKDEQDCESIVEKIMSLSKEEANQLESEILGKYPNTYTYTKNLSEKQIIKNKGDMKVVICRPSIIASSLYDPFPGWTDSMSAAGGVVCH